MCPLLLLLLSLLSICFNVAWKEYKVKGLLWLTGKKVIKKIKSHKKISQIQQTWISNAVDSALVMFFRSMLKQIHPGLFNFCRVCLRTYLFSTFFWKDLSDFASLALKGIRFQIFCILWTFVFYFYFFFPTLIPQHTNYTLLLTIIIVLATKAVGKLCVNSGLQYIMVP